MENKNIPKEMKEMMNVQQLQQSLLNGEWIEEAKQIPLDDVNSYERDLLIKCINREPFDPLELDDLQKLLGRYRGALEKYEPLETIENVENNIQLVKDEKELLRLMQKAKETQILNINYPLTDEYNITYKLLVINEIDAEVLDNLQENLELFTDLTQEELEIYQDYTGGKAQTSEEMSIAKDIARKIELKGMQNASKVKQTAIDFLSKQTRLADDPNSSEIGMKAIYSEMKLGYLMAVFEKVQSLVGVTEIDTDALFRQIS